MTNSLARDGIRRLVSFYSAIGRPLTLLEIHRAAHPNSTELVSTLEDVERMCREKTLISQDGFYIAPPAPVNFSLNRRIQDCILDKKWKRLMRLGKWFAHIPFIEFVLVNGSMALGNVTASSDFDVLICVRGGRIFTARYAALFIFTLLGARRTKDRENDDPDKLCFNHFVTEKMFVKPPFNEYRYSLYRAMIPFWGNPEKIKNFFDANEWCNPPDMHFGDLQYQGNDRGAVRKFLENALSRTLGEWFEQKILKPIAWRRLRKYIDAQHTQGRIALSDDELEFHFNLSGEKRFS